MYTGSQTARLDLQVEATEGVRVPDRMPAGWPVPAGNDHPVREANCTQYVEFDDAT